MEILDHYGYPLQGKKAVVVGRSLVVGRPAAMLLLQKNATVTVCHTRHGGYACPLPGGRGSHRRRWQSRRGGEGIPLPGQVVIDVGIHVLEDGKLTGDVKFEEAEPIVEAITPVPGGVGTVTTSVLVKHVVEAAEKASK